MATHYQVVLTFDDLSCCGGKDPQEEINELNKEIQQAKFRVWEPFKLVLDDMAVGEFRNHPVGMVTIFRNYSCSVYFNDDSHSEKLKELK